jgi:thioredoxin 1
MSARKQREDPAMKPTAVSDSTFDAEVLRASEPVLVDFWAEWCGPCKMIAPFLDEIASEMEGQVTVAKLNIDENPQTPRKYGIRGIPTMILFKGGQAVKTVVGAYPKKKIESELEPVLA